MIVRPDGEPAAQSGAENYYALLQVAPDASLDDIRVAFQQQHARCDPKCGAPVSEQFVVMAEARRKDLDAAFAVLSDPGRRFEYDRQLGLLGDEVADRRGISNREVILTVAGIMVALLILVWLWGLSGRMSLPQREPAVAEMNFPARPFALRTLDGQRFELAAQLGKVVLVNFWATWCKPCEEEMPALQAAYHALADEGLVIVGVDLYDAERAQGRGEQEVRAFTSRYGVQYPIVLDETGQVARDYRISPIPVSYFIDPAGAVRFVRVGQLTSADVEMLFRRLQDGLAPASRKATFPQAVGQLAPTRPFGRRD